MYRRFFPKMLGELAYPTVFASEAVHIPGNRERRLLDLCVFVLHRDLPFSPAMFFSDYNVTKDLDMRDLCRYLYDPVFGWPML